MIMYLALMLAEACPGGEGAGIGRRGEGFTATVHLFHVKVVKFSVNLWK